MYKINVKRTSEKAGIPQLNGSLYNITCIDINTRVGRDGRLILVYRTGLKIEMPLDKIGMIIPRVDASMYSVEFAGGLKTINPGTYDELVIEMKTNTDSIPAIFEPGDVICSLAITDITAVEFNEEIETIEPLVEEVTETAEA